MKHSDFVHLHLHTEYSLLDGACRIDKVVEKAQELRMPAVALTDHGGMYGVVEFYQAAQEHGVKPIIGCEVYVAPGSRLEKKAASARDAAYHLILLAKDETGYRNLVKLVSAAHLEGFYYKPRIDKELLAQRAQGLIGLTACLKGEVPSKLLNDQEPQAKQALDDYRQIFAPGDFYVELHDHGLEAQQRVNRTMRGWAREFKMPVVASNDVHYTEHAHHEAHDVLVCLQTGAMQADEKRLRYAGDQFYLKTPEEMQALFAEVPEALRNTLAIAEKCNVRLEFGKPRFPVYEAPAGTTRERYLRQLCEQGLQKRYGIAWRQPADDQAKQLVARLEHELSVIERTHYVSYFLIVWDFVHFAKSHGIPVGPGRGSAAGSLVAYLLEITNIDPLRYGLLFERFLNPERVSPPDIDMDFCYNRRPEVIKYVREKYGDDHVAQIITFGTLGAKMVVRDVGRVLGLPYGDCDRLAKLIPADLGMTLEKALKLNPELKTAYDSEELTKRVIDYGFTLEGLARNASTHAAGVVIGAEPLTNIVPLTTGTNSNEVVTQFSMNPLGDLGLLKMDFLGLKTLTVIRDALDLIEQTTGQRLDIDAIPLEDQPTFDLLNKANTIGVFQLESQGMRDLCRRIGVDSIDVINALIALYRPGPMEMIDPYVARKHGKVQIEYDHPLLEPILKETYGIFVYQEQVMQATNVLAGFSLGKADILRRAMGKKKAEEMEKQRAVFVKGCADTNKIPRGKAEKIFDMLEKFAGYGFNKSHSAAYAVVAYQTAWLKANYPVEFMAALLSNDMAHTDKIQLFINECRHLGIPVLPPDVNESGVKFTVVKDPGATGAPRRAIRFGMAAVKNVGEIAVQCIVDVRAQGGPFRSFADFCERIDLRVVNRKVLESLVKCGAADSLATTPGGRAALFGLVEYQMNRATSLQRDRERGQTALFDLGAAADAAPAPRNLSRVEWSESQMLGFEKELLGFYVSGHPLTQYAAILQRYDLATSAQLGTLQQGQATRIGGILGKVQPKITKAGKPMATATLEDLEGATELVVFPETYAKCQANLRADAPVFVRGVVDIRDDKPQLLVDELIPLPEVAQRFTRAVHLRLPVATTRPELLDRVRELLLARRGNCPVWFCFLYPTGTVVFVEASEHFAVTPSEQLVTELENLLGEDTVWLKVDTEKLQQTSPRRERRFGPG